MTAIEFDVMKMQHSRLIAEIAAENEAAHRESALDGWLSDHAGRVRLLAEEAKIIEEEIKTAISGCGHIDAGPALDGCDKTGGIEG